MGNTLKPFDEILEIINRKQKVNISKILNIIIKLENDLDNNPKIFEAMVKDTPYYSPFALLCKLKTLIINDDEKLFFRFEALLTKMAKINTLYGSKEVAELHDHAYYDKIKYKRKVAIAIYYGLEDIALEILKNDITSIDKLDSSWMELRYSTTIDKEYNGENKTISNINTFMFACVRQMKRVVNLILDESKNDQLFEFVTQHNETPLILLCKLEMEDEALKLLQRCKKNVWVKNNYGLMAIHYAMQNKMHKLVAEIIKMLGYRETDTLIEMSREVLIAGCLYDDVNSVAFLLKRYGVPRDQLIKIYDLYASDKTKYLFPTFCDPDNKFRVATNDVIEKTDDNDKQIEGHTREKGENVQG